MALATTALFAEPKLSSAYYHCIDSVDATTSSMVKCNGDELQRQDKRLNETYKRVMTTLDDRQKNELKTLQRAWMAYRDIKCSFYYSFTGGTIDRLNGSFCMIIETANQADELKSLESY